ncbi:MAG: TolC family outer membrane protein [Methylococcaceae bacterium]|nr:TolC family outer membrane protein [Methylococcaceae bacterium]
MLKPLILMVALSSATAFTTQAVADNKPQSLLDTYNQALGHDPTLASALSANKAAQEIIEQGKALYRPIVNFNAGANISRTDISFSGTGVPFRGGVQSFEGYQYGLEARQPLYRKQNLVQMEQSQTQVSLADKQLHLSQQTLILRTTQVYFEVLIAQDKIDLLNAQKAAIASQLEQAKANYDAGNATITDVNEAQARNDLIVAQLLGANNDFEIAKRGVKAITGAMPQKLATVKTDLKPHTVKQSLDKWLDVATQNNLNIQIQQDAAKFSAQEIERAQAGHLPTLDAVASYNEQYANGSAWGFGSDQSTATIGVQLQIPLYQGGATSSRIRQATLNKQKALDDVDIARRQTELETQRAYLNLNTSIAQVQAYEQALNSSQSQVDSTSTGYDVGVRTSVDVLNAQQQLFAAKRDLLQARYHYLVNIIQLKAASGVIAEADLADINQQLLLR